MYMYELYIFRFEINTLLCYTVVSVLVLGIGIARGQYYWILDIGCLVWYRSNPTYEIGRSIGALVGYEEVCPLSFPRIKKKIWSQNVCIFSGPSECLLLHCITSSHRCWLSGAMGAIAPWPKGGTPKSPHRNFMSIFWNNKMSQFLHVGFG